VRAFAGSYPREARPTGRVRELTITAAPARIPLLDGAPLSVWAYDGQVPGPTVRIRLGDTLRATLWNQLPQPTTIHWHGVRVPNAMDGVPGVTQPAVEPGARFTYEFTPKDAGTFWFHPHIRSSEQVERGLYGVLVVDDDPPLPWSRDEVWVLDDWRLGPDGEIAPEFNTRHDLMHDGRWGQTVTVNGDRGMRLKVRAGERIRLRLVDVANGRVFAPDFGELAPQAIATDGMYAAHPFDPRGIELAPGNRLDLDLTIDPGARGKSFAVWDRFVARQPNLLATIEVADEPAVATPAFPSPAHAHLPDWRAARAEVRATFDLDARAGGPYGIEWTINGQAFRHEDHAAGHAPAVLATLPAGEFSRLRFTNESFRLHPMHLHGQFFRLLARNGAAVDEPHWRDTVLLHAKESVEVGLVPLDPGRWMMHCHVLEHAESGMMSLVEVR
jgi:FtsP/CotA-like multicopper oxidase with cupredoxin domain